MVSVRRRRRRLVPVVSRLPAITLLPPISPPTCKGDRDREARIRSPRLGQRTHHPHARISAATYPGKRRPRSRGTITVTARLALAGGSAGIHFGLSGSQAVAGSLGPVSCQHSSKAFTSCSVTYTAPSSLPATEVAYLVADAPGSLARTDTRILLNTAGVASNPTQHQGPLPTLMPLGSSGGNNHDYDARGNTVADCCSGTLGALIQDNSGRQFLLSNNHVLARSDRASVGDPIVQPGLIDNNCTPSGEGPGTVPVAALSAWLPLNSAQTNADAAIAQVASRTIDATEPFWS